MNTGVTTIVTEHIRDYKNDPIIVTSIKSPAKINKKVIGVIGLSIIQTHASYNAFKNFNLTKREYTCLRYITKGKTAQQIADILFISKRTVEKHIENIKSKLHCESKSQLIEKAIENGFVKFI